jgi:hypothetical protein
MAREARLLETTGEWRSLSVGGKVQTKRLADLPTAEDRDYDDREPTAGVVSRQRRL